MPTWESMTILFLSIIQDNIPIMLYVRILAQSDHPFWNIPIT